MASIRLRTSGRSTPAGARTTTSRVAPARVGARSASRFWACCDSAPGRVKSLRNWLPARFAPTVVPVSTSIHSSTAVHR
jgi:hypothetical protein